MADFPPYLRQRDLAAGLGAAFDREQKIVRALDALGPVADRDVLLLGPGGDVRASQLRSLGGRVMSISPEELRGVGAAGTSAAGPTEPRAATPPTGQVLVSMWSAFRGGAPTFDADVAAAERALEPEGRLLVVHDYARDDVSRLLRDDERDRELVQWSDRRGWFLTRGFRVRVIHSWWTFDTLEQAADLLASAFGAAGTEVAASLRRPRLSYKVAVYHRTLGADAGARRADGNTG